MAKARARYQRVFPLPACVPAGSVVIRDLAVEHQTMSVTNDAEAVVRDLVASGQVARNARLFYFDTDGNLDELVIEAGEFVRFAPGPGERVTP